MYIQNYGKEFIRQTCLMINKVKRRLKKRIENFDRIKSASEATSDISREQYIDILYSKLAEVEAF